MVKLGTDVLTVILSPNLRRKEDILGKSLKGKVIWVEEYVILVKIGNTYLRCATPIPLTSKTVMALKRKKAQKQDITFEGKNP